MIGNHRRVPPSTDTVFTGLRANGNTLLDRVEGERPRHSAYARTANFAQRRKTGAGHADIRSFRGGRGQRSSRTVLVAISLSIVLAARNLAIGAVLLVGLAACTSHHAHSATTAVQQANTSDSAVAPPALRPCRALIGKPAYAAIIGEQVTCSFGGSDTSPHQVNVLVEKCPDTSVFYVFYSTAHDATDHGVYYGAEGSPLFSTSHKAASFASETRQACAT
jgi:hypothetical protein